MHMTVVILLYNYISIIKILLHLKESKKEIDPMTQMTYEFYKRKQSEE